MASIISIPNEGEGVQKRTATQTGRDRLAFPPRKGRSAAVEAAPVAPAFRIRRQRRSVMAAIVCAAVASSAFAFDRIDIVGSIYCDGEWIPGHLACTPEAKAKAAAAAEAARAKERERLREQQRLDALVAAEVKRLGPHRADEARRLVEMRESAAAARGRPGPAAPGKEPPVLVDRPHPKCEMRPMVRGVSTPLQATPALAMAVFNREAARECQGAGFTGAPKCTTSDHSLYAAMPIGKRPKSDPPRMMTICAATVTCAKQERVCESRSATGSKQ